MLYLLSRSLFAATHNLSVNFNFNVIRVEQWVPIMDQESDYRSGTPEFTPGF
jgi:hypothetical protein